MIIGTNGYIWIAPLTAQQDDAMDIDGDTPQPAKKKAVVTREMRLNMARVRNSIVALARLGLAIHPTTISAVFQRSVELQIQPKKMLEPDMIVQITDIPTLSDTL